MDEQPVAHSQVGTDEQTPEQAASAAAPPPTAPTPAEGPGQSQGSAFPSPFPARGEGEPALDAPTRPTPPRPPQPERAPGGEDAPDADATPRPAPAYPGYPLSPAAPAYPPYPAYPSYPPPAPPYPLYPGAAYPGGPYPGAPSMPLAASPYPPYSQPPYSQPPYSQPPYSQPPYSQPPYSQPLFQAPQPPARPGFWERPFSPLARVVIGAGAALLVVALFLLTEAFGGDWFEGVTVASILALGLGVIAFALGALRFALGRRAASTLLLGLTLVGALLLGGGAGLVLAPSLHATQAHALEQSQQWQAAITEYQRAGEQTPNAQDIARVYVEWGEQQLHRGFYRDATPNFKRALNAYASESAITRRAQDDLYAAYKQWLASGDQAVPAYDITLFIGQRRALSWCDSACQQDADATEAQARYVYGQQLVAYKSYGAAASQFEIIQKQFPHSPYAPKAHAAAATAYLNQGQSQRQQYCPDAVPTYQTLASNYGDTPEGAQAKRELAASQDVSGILDHFPTNPTPTMSLNKRMDPANFYFSGEYTARVDASTGAFTFHGVTPGDYNISASVPVPNGTQYAYWTTADKSAFYVMHVGPLCPYNAGDFTFSN